MTTTHTPGPWRTAALGDFITTATGSPVAILDSDNYRADGALIAAAPELLAALREVVAEADAYEAKHGPMRRPWVRIARAAIAKAEGRAAL